MKATFFALAAVVGSVFGVLGYFVTDFSNYLPFSANDPKVWAGHGSLISVGGGAICGVVMGWAAFVWFYKVRSDVPAPSEIAPATLTTQSRRNIRPLKWLHRP